MRTFHLRPAPELRPFIDRFWGWQSPEFPASARNPGQASTPLPLLLPGTGAEIYFHREAPFQALASAAANGEARNAREEIPPPAQALPDAHLLALRRRVLHLLPAPRVDFIAVRFRAGMIHRFTPIPGAELADAPLTPRDLWGPAGAALAARLAETPSLPARAALLHAFLRARLRPEAPDALAEAAVDRLYRLSPAGAPWAGDAAGRNGKSAMNDTPDGEMADAGIDRLAAGLGLGRRQLERRVGALTGLAPVAWKRLVRLQKTARRLALAPDASLTDTALALGYYDQAHCIRDFRALAGLTPGQYRALLAGRTHFYNPPGSSAGILTTPSPTSR